jgi:uncharacterized protein (TIGR03435 family)
MKSGIVALVLGFAALVTGQQSVFDVVSVKRSSPNANGMSVSSTVNRFRTTNATVISLILNAYPEFHSFQIVGAPSWAQTEGYDVDARSEFRLTPDAVGEMLQALLYDRFKLQMHSETRDMPLYVLTVAKDGARLQQSNEGERTSISGGHGRMSFQRTGMAGFAANLAYQLDRIVVDKTGLTANYTFTLEWTPDSTHDSDSTAPSIFTAIQEQLGLKLESTKGPVEVLVIERLERPAEN